MAFKGSNLLGYIMTRLERMSAIYGKFPLRAAMRIITSAFYLVAGYLHLSAPRGFVLITPGYE